VSQGLNEQYLPVWLQEAGYNTYYTGKLFNAHNIENYNAPYPAGFTGSDFLLDPFTYQYLNSTWQRNRDAPVNHEGEYTTDIITEKAAGFLNDAIKAQKPFFLTIAPVAPHSNVEFNGNDFNDLSTLRVTPPVSAERHKHLFKDVKVPRTDHFNPKEVSYRDLRHSIM
jgi:arylsulfatase A-like enzyme